MVGLASQNKNGAVNGAALGHVPVQSSYIQLQSNTLLDIAKAVLAFYPTRATDF